MTQRESFFAVLTAAGALSMVLAHAQPAQAQPSADQVLADMGISDADKQRALGGEFVTNDVKPVSDRDLSISIVFLVKASPDALAKEVMSGDLVRDDPQVKAGGEIKGPGTKADFAGLTINADSAAKFAGAQAGQALNLSTTEIAAFDALQGTAPSAVQPQLQQMLLARYQAYQAAGLAGIAPYDRGGSTTDSASDLRKASDAAAGLKKYLPSFQKVLVSYPNATVAGMSQKTSWVEYDIDGVTTYVLSHRLIAPDGDARAVVQRQYYVSTGYNAEQAVAAFLPVEAGTLVVYTNHTFTDQVAGFGGSAKRSIGRRMMEGKLQAMFDRERKDVAH